MIGFIISAIKIIILLGFLVFIHEFGHFIVAKICKVKVNEFALGFGPILWKKQGKETKYQLRLIPFGGFVSMEGETGQSDDSRAFNKVSIPKRIAIVAAGGLVNILFAVIVFMGLELVVGNNVTTKVENTISGYVAEVVGIQPGDTIEKINGKKVKLQADINKIVSKSKGEELSIEVDRNGKKIQYKFKPTATPYYTTGMYLEDEHSTKIQGFDAKESVEGSGFKVGDTIISIEGQMVENDSNKLTELLNNIEENKELEFVVRRLGKEVTIRATPIKKYHYSLGINLVKAENNFKNNLYYGLINTGDFVGSMFDNLKQLFTGEVRASDFMGPVGISKTVAKTDTIKSFILILTLISLSLGVTNLLPIPPLDGGKIVLLLIEAIIRKPIDEKYEIGIQLLGFGLMILLSLYVTYHDIIRCF